MKIKISRRRRARPVVLHAIDSMPHPAHWLISTQVDAELDVDGAIFRFVDTAGVRRKARVKDGTETQMVGRALKAAKLADVVLLVVDATSEVTDQDAMLAQRIADDGRACVVLANKWDIYEGKDEGSTREVLKVLRETLTAVSWAEVVFCSAETGQRSVWKSASVSGALTRPCWLRRVVRKRHRHAIEQAVRRWRGGRREDIARTRHKI